MYEVQVTIDPPRIVIKGPIPCSHLEGLTAHMKAMGIEVIDAEITEALGVTLAATSFDECELWAEELGLRKGTT